MSWRVLEEGTAVVMKDVSELQQLGLFNIGPTLQSRNPLTASMEEAQMIGNIPIRYEARLLNTARLCMGESGVFF